MPIALNLQHLQPGPSSIETQGQTQGQTLARQPPRRALRVAVLALLAPLGLAGCMEAEPEYLPPLPDMAMQTQTKGVPCAVAKLMADRCLVCHGQPPARAPISLVSYENLTGPSDVDAQKKVIERAVIRMQDGTDPMPPGPTATVPPSEIAAVQAWIAAGTPMSTCQGM